MLRFDAKLWERIAVLAKKAGRTPRQEIEWRLRTNLSETPGGDYSPARALGRLVELHASDLAPFSQSAEEWQAGMRESIPALLCALFGEASAEPASQQDSFAVEAARTLAEKVLRANVVADRPNATSWAAAAERALAQELPSLGQLQRDELLRIQRALGLAPADSP